MFPHEFEALKIFLPIPMQDFNSPQLNLERIQAQLPKNAEKIFNHQTSNWTFCYPLEIAT